MSKVSILIPAYNSEKYIAATIQSCVDQTYRDIEIIIVDDGSSDNTLSLAKGYSSDIVKVYGQKNAGACRARNHAFELSSGDYIMYLDADDLLSANKVESQMKIATLSSKRTLFSGRWDKFTEGIADIVTVARPMYNDYDNIIDFFKTMWSAKEMMQTSVWMAHRDLIKASGGWDESLLINQDGEFFCRVAAISDSIRFAGQAHVYYRTNVRNSVSRRALNRDRAESLLRSFESYENTLFPKDDSLELKQALAWNYDLFLYVYNEICPDLCKDVRKKLRSWGVSQSIDVGGNGFKKIAGIIGFNNALRIRRLIKGLN